MRRGSSLRCGWPAFGTCFEPTRKVRRRWMFRVIYRNCVASAKRPALALSLLPSLAMVCLILMPCVLTAFKNFERAVSSITISVG